MAKRARLDNWKPGPRARGVRDAVARAYGIAPTELTGRGRMRELVRVRHLAFWVVRQTCPLLSLPMIGKLFEGCGD